MCGIAAVWTLNECNINIELADILTSISARGEFCYQRECHIERKIGLGCNRLAITSKPNEKQPAVSSNGEVILVLNGEIYNANELANKHLSTSINTDNDCQILAELISIVGVEVFNEIDGMYAAVWLKNGKLNAVRDHIGIKPLYYSVNDNMLWLSSEIKGLSNNSDVKTVESVPPGNFIEFFTTNGKLGFTTKCINSFDTFHTEVDGSGIDINILRQKIISAVERRTRYSGPIGLLLSGGVDSAGIYAIARSVHKNIIPISLGNKNSPDLKYVRRISEYFNEDIFIVDCPSEQELFEDIHDTIRIAESFEPNTIRSTSVQRVLIDSAAQQGLKVVLCGEGADEVFCGYPEFFRHKDWHNLRIEFLNDLNRTQLQRVDRSSMNQTIEVRVPYLSLDVISYALQDRRRSSFIDGDRNKVCLRSALKAFLPDWLADRPKMVILEGAGLRGNHPSKGMFADIAASKISAKNVREIINEFPEWSIKTPEEAYYFSIFQSLGYHKALFTRNRVAATKA